jgi:hypothetical protein
MSEGCVVGESVNYAVSIGGVVPSVGTVCSSAGGEFVFPSGDVAPARPLALRLGFAASATILKGHRSVRRQSDRGTPNVPLQRTPLFVGFIWYCGFEDRTQM